MALVFAAAESSFFCFGFFASLLLRFCPLAMIVSNKPILRGTGVHKKLSKLTLKIWHMEKRAGSLPAVAVDYFGKIIMERARYEVI